jgi:hypothetical protein
LRRRLDRNGIQRPFTIVARGTRAGGPAVAQWVARLEAVLDTLRGDGAWADGRAVRLLVQD